ncbi:glycoside hydrolase family 3 protein [Oscillospiraceae bacterium HV4-5-C5C]|nr:glycoside hydrolase family 3 protein [Oscillospiraceae bacterium HV4-5-C5C]
MADQQQTQIPNPAAGQAAYNLDSAAHEQSLYQQAAELVRQMTLEEKISQTVNHAPAIPRLGIEAYDWWNEALHGVARAGVATVFPQAISLAASFNTSLLGQVADVIAEEGRAKYNVQRSFGDHDIYKGLTFWAPNVNIFRDPRWGRGQETYGEDPYLTSRLAVSFIRHLQGNGRPVLKALACAKHFAVHSGPEAKRHEFNARASARDLAETYLPAFKAAVQEAGVESVMGAYNRTNGEPCCGSPTLLQKTLREAWGFQGHVVTDCWAVKDFHEHHRVTTDAVESVALAMNSGADLNCGELFLLLGQAVKEGLVSEQRLDAAVTRLLAARLKLGILQQQSSEWDQIPYTVVDSTQHQAVNRQAAREAVVLLKNQAYGSAHKPILPLTLKPGMTIGVVGPNANSRAALVGNYEGTASRYETVLEGIQEIVGPQVRVLTSELCHLFRSGTSGLSQGSDRLSEAWAVAQNSDVVIAVLGLDASLEGEEGDASNEYGSGDKPNLKLPGEQQAALELLQKSGKPVILVLMSGSAIAVTQAAESAAVPAILWAGYPGSYGGRAIAEILLGQAIPSAKLPITFYRSSEELPDFEDYSMAGRTYKYMSGEALYPFGYGLSYTTFELTAEASSQQVPGDGESVTIAVHVKNTGTVDALETVQLYVRAWQADAPHWALKAFDKVAVEAGASVGLRFTLPRDAFSLCDDNGQFYIPKGRFTVYVGDAQPDERSARLLGRRPVELTFTQS